MKIQIIENVDLLNKADCDFENQDILYITSAYKDKLNIFMRATGIEECVNTGSVKRLLKESRKTGKAELIIYIGEKNNFYIVAKYLSYIKEIDLKSYPTWHIAENELTDLEKTYDIFIFICDEKEKAQIQIGVGRFLDKIPCGIFCSRTAEELLFSITKNMLAPLLEDRKILSVNRTDMHAKEIEKLDNRVYIPRSLATVENLKNYGNSNNALFSFTILGHGRDELIWLTNGVFCCSDEQSDTSEHKPNCIQCGTCFKNNVDILNASEFPAFNMFINSCCSAKMSEAVFGDAYSLMYGFMNNYVISYIGTPYLVEGIPAINNYYLALILSGYKLGFIVNLLNQYYINYGFGSESVYYLFGDPSVKYTTVYEKETKNIDNLMKSHLIETMNSIYLLEVICSDRLFYDFITYKKEVIVKNNHNNILYVNIYFDKKRSKTILHIFSDHRMEPGQFRILINERNGGEISMMKKFDYLVELGFCDSKLKNFYQESLNASGTYIADARIKLTRLDNVAITNYSKRDKILKRIDTLSKRIVDYFSYETYKKGFAFDEACLQHGFHIVNREYNGEKCPYCAGELAEHTIYNSFFDKKRRHIYCSKCGNILDGPNEKDINIRFGSSEKFCVSEKKGEISVNLENNTNNTIWGYLAVTVAQGYQNGFKFVPDICEIILKPYSKKIISFDFLFSNVECHNYWLIANAVMSSEIYVIKKDIFFVKGENRE